MMPRGEVGLIFASIGKSLGVITDALFSAVVLMVLITTLMAPPLLKLTLAPGPGTTLKRTPPASGHSSSIRKNT